MNKQTLTIAALLMLAMTGAGCQSGYDSKSTAPAAADGPSGNNNEGNNGQNIVPPSEDWGGVGSSLTGKVDGGQYDGKLTVFVDQPGQALIFRLPVPTAILIPLFAEFPIASLPGASVTHSLDANGERQFLVKMPFKYIVRDANLAVYNQLPNGSPLPFMPAVESRGFAIDLPQKKDYRLHLYFAANAAAAFIEIPEIPEIPYMPSYMGFPIKNEAKTQITGFLGIYARKGTNAAGVYVASRVPDQVAVLIDELIKY